MKNLKTILHKTKLSWSFVIIVAIPSIFAVIYFGFVASDRYVSVSNFVVRSPQRSASVSGLSAFLQSSGFARSQDDSYVVNDYMMSRDAVTELNHTLDLRKIYTASHIDLLSRFNPLNLDNSLENLYDYYQNRVKVTLESNSSISTLEVRAYSAQEAFEINNKLLNMAELLINKLNQRGRQDLISNAEQEVKNAQKRVASISAALVKYRNKNQIFDVEKQSVIQLQLISKLQDQLILVQTQISQLKLVTPENPQLTVLTEREKSISNQIDKIQKTMLGNGENSLNNKSVDYERLTVEKEVATKQLASALATLEQSKNDADKKQLYLERIAQPNIPDDAIEPKRIKNIISTILISLILWGIYSLLTAGVREHQG